MVRRPPPVLWRYWCTLTDRGGVYPEPAMSTDTALRRRRYRRFVIVSVSIVGIAVGVGLGSLAALIATWELLLLLLFPLGFRVIGSALGWLRTVDPIGWLWPVVALPVACATYVLVPADAAGIGVGLAVTTWFVMIVVGGVLEVVFDPDGRIAGSTE